MENPFGLSDTVWFYILNILILCLSGVGSIGGFGWGIAFFILILFGIFAKFFGATDPYLRYFMYGLIVILILDVVWFIVTVLSGNLLAIVIFINAIIIGLDYKVTQRLV